MKDGKRYYFAELRLNCTDEIWDATVGLIDKEADQVVATFEVIVVGEEEWDEHTESVIDILSRSGAFSLITIEELTGIFNSIMQPQQT